MLPLLTVLAASAALAVRAEVVSGAAGYSDFVYLGKYCFGKDGGTINWQVTKGADAILHNVDILLFDDERGSWGYVDGNDWSCSSAEMKGVAKQSNAIVEGKASGSGQFVIPASSEPHFYYVGAARRDCGGAATLEDFNLHFKQKDGSEISYNERGLPGLYTTLMVIWAILVPAHIYLHYFHFHFAPPHVELVTLSWVLQLTSTICLCAHWLTFAKNGVGNSFFFGLGEFAHTLSFLSLWVMAGLVAIGYGISFASINDRGLNVVGMFLIVFVLAMYMVLWIWYSEDQDPSSEQYLYDSWVGITMAVMQLVYCIWFVYTSLKTRSNEPQNEGGQVRRDYYLRFACLFAFAFLIVPLASILGGAVQPYNAQHTIESVNHALYVLLALVTSYLLWPPLFERAFAMYGLDGIVDDDGNLLATAFEVGQDADGIFSTHAVDGQPAFGGGSGAGRYEQMGSGDEEEDGIGDSQL